MYIRNISSYLQIIKSFAIAVLKYDFANLVVMNKLYSIVLYSVLIVMALLGSSFLPLVSVANGQP
jgi:hypothetical protein